MSDQTRWSIEELLARYDLEPQLADVFVEGSFDKEILSQVFNQSARRATFYEVDTVDVPPDLLRRHGLTSGNKQRLIALSKEFEALTSDASVVCLVDRDLDHWFGNISDTHRLRWTRFCCIESHFITREIVIDVALTTGASRIKQVDIFVISLFNVLKTLYAFRLADRELSLSLKWVALRKYLARDGDAVQLNTDKYVAATLGANAALAKKQEFAGSWNTWLTKLDGDVRLSARGHDYTELLAWAIGEFNGHKAFGQQAAVERLLVLLARSVPTISNELQ
ncbi:hypothetical protein [Ramlibacter sp. 2FC]|uniref:hypothetical protein n=1 Tax=Ramlibacter sp. 2FC TaxID=2502188 RepID=UPI0010F87879|nr:hypothetical protein [Ramlibacter sp. 2FC]